MKAILKKASYRQARAWPAQLGMVWLGPIAVLAGASCTPVNRAPSGVATAWQEQSVARAGVSPLGRGDVNGDMSDSGVSRIANDPAVAATVNERPITSERIVSLLLAGRGAAVLHDLVSLEVVRAEAESMGLSASRRDVVAERNRMLRALRGGSGANEVGPFDRTAAEAMLEEVLRRRGVSGEEFQIAIDRNALLRKIAARRIDLSEEALAEEYQRAYGRRAHVRHIQVASMRQAERIIAELSGGADFAELARQVSTAPSAREGGLLPPMTETDPGVPAIVRETAFAMREGQVSSAIRVGYGYQVLLLERFVEPADIPFADVREELESQLRDRMTEALMPVLLAELERKAKVKVLDPALKSRYERLLENINGNPGESTNAP